MSGGGRPRAAAWDALLSAALFGAAAPLSKLLVERLPALQLAGLLYMTGGLTNPFSLLLTVPVVVSATSLPIRMTALLAAFVGVVASLLAFAHLPLPWIAGALLEFPTAYVAGMWLAVISAISFTAGSMSTYT